MKEKVFELVNQMNTNLEEYEEIILTDYENELNCKRIMMKLHKIKKKQRIKNIGKKIAVAGFLAVFGVACLSIVSYASNGQVFPFLYTFFNGSSITYTQRDEMDITEIEMDATKNPPVRLKEGRLYLTVGEETIDITKQISVDEPYIWEWEDKQGNIHKFIIGGEPYEASYGYEENIFKKDGSFIGASSYYGSHIKGMEENKEPEWLIRGRKEIER